MFWCKGERSWNWVGGEDLVLVSLESIFSTIPADIKWSRHKTNILLGKSFSCLSFCLFFYLSFEIFFFFTSEKKLFAMFFFFSFSHLCNCKWQLLLRVERKDTEFEKEFVPGVGRGGENDKSATIWIWQGISWWLDIFIYFFSCWLGFTFISSLYITPPYFIDLSSSPPWS